MTRLDRVLANLKYGSRKDCQTYIKKGLVSVNGVVCTKADKKITETDCIVFNDTEIKYLPNFILMLNKPNGYISSNVDGIYPSVLNLIDEPYNRYDLKIAGRLDVDTTGLLLITNVGSYVHKIASPNSKVVKTYLAELKNPWTNKDADNLLKPMILRDGENKQYIAKATSVKLIDKYTVEIKIDMGKYHQVKNMVLNCGNEVVNLKRIAIGNLNLPSDLKIGEYKEVKLNEITYAEEQSWTQLLFFVKIK